MTIVAQDGSGDFKTIQAALDAVPATGAKRYFIYVKAGEYEEKVVVTKPYVSLIGEGAVTITYGDYAKKLKEDKTEMGTFSSYSVLVAANGFVAKNIVFKNHAGRGDEVGQAVAVYADGDQLEFHNCFFMGHQDTLFTAPLPPAPLKGCNFGGPRDDAEKRVGRHYFYQCYLEGDVDFIFGSATVVFKECEIHSLNRDRLINGYITAASTQEGQKFGYVFLDCRLTSDAAANTVYLGRPWRNYAKTAFINCWMDKHIRDEGWHNWNRVEAETTTEYAEFGSKGPGGKMDKRANWSKLLTVEEANRYCIEKVLEVDQDWSTWE